MEQRFIKRYTPEFHQQNLTHFFACHPVYWTDMFDVGAALIHCDDVEMMLIHDHDLSAVDARLVEAPC